jgi:hypothetical protein
MAIGTLRGLHLTARGGTLASSQPSFSELSQNCHWQEKSVENRYLLEMTGWSVQKYIFPRIAQMNAD